VVFPPDAVRKTERERQLKGETMLLVDASPVSQYVRDFLVAQACSRLLRMFSLSPTAFAVLAVVCSASHSHSVETLEERLYLETSEAERAVADLLMRHMVDREGSDRFTKTRLGCTVTESVSICLGQTLYRGEN
jgi:hypothetical protein